MSTPHKFAVKTECMEACRWLTIMLGIKKTINVSYYYLERG